MKIRKIRTVFLEILAILLFLIFLFPFFIVLINSAKSSSDIIRNPLMLPQDWSMLWKNMQAVIHNPNMNYWNSFFSSSVITVLSLITIVLFSSMTAWVLVRNKKKWSNIFYLGFVAAMVIPFQVVMLPFLSWFRVVGNFINISLLSSYQGTVFAYIGFGVPMTIFILHGFIKNIPYELEEAALIDGCTPEKTFFYVIFPLLRPIQMTVLILNGIWIWNDFLLPSLMLGLNGNVKTLPIAVTSFVGSYVKQWDLILTSTLLAMLPIVIFFLIAQKYIIKGMVEGAIK